MNASREGQGTADEGNPGGTPGGTPAKVDFAGLGAALDERLSAADELLIRDYPGDQGARQPVHTVYIPADRIRPGTSRQWGEQAAAALREHAPDPASLAAATGTDAAMAAEVYPLVLAKLAAEPVEDLRVDVEDGYLSRSDEQEDADVRAAAKAVRADLDAAAAPPYFGIRAQGMEAKGRRRGLRSLALFLETLLDGAPAEDGLPKGFVITLPKITSVAQVEAMVWTTERMEEQLGLASGALRFELQIETPQSVLGADGTATVARMLHAGAGRVTALHYGTYDYSAACGVTAALQSMAHPVADHAKSVMQVAAAGTGVWLSDGATNILPVGTREQVHQAWELHARLVRRSLDRAYYQGWDMHAHQLPTRYLTTFAFYREAFAPAAARLRAYLDAVEGGIMDEPATAQALAGVLLRGLHCGALTDEEVATAAGTDRATLEGFAHRRVG